MVLGSNSQVKPFSNPSKTDRSEWAKNDSQVKPFNTEITEIIITSLAQRWFPRKRGQRFVYNNKFKIKNMAQRRMFTKEITNSSRFLMMPPTSQLLYIHFGMNADDDGFCEHFSIMRMVDAKPDDLKVLAMKGFVRVFDEKVLIITEWKDNNYIQKDRYSPSKYLKIYEEELKALSSGDSDVYKMDTQVRLELGKVRLGKETLTDKQVAGNDILSLTDYFIRIKNSKERKERYFRVAGELLTLCDHNLEKAKKKIDKIKEWADKEGMEWELDTAVKKFMEI